MPPLGFFVAQLACVGLGIARAALDEVTGLAATKVPSLYMEPLARRPAAQIDLARAEAALGAARAYLYATTEDIWEALGSGGAPSSRQLALARAAETQAVETAAAVARTASTLAGGGSLYLASALQRHVRDTEAMTHHFTVAPPTWEQAGAGPARGRPRGPGILTAAGCGRRGRSEPEEGLPRGMIAPGCPMTSAAIACPAARPAASAAPRISAAR